MNEDNQEEKQQRESVEQFCKRLGIRINKRSGGQEFSPYHGLRKVAKEPPEGLKKVQPRNSS